MIFSIRQGLLLAGALAFLAAGCGSQGGKLPPQQAVTPATETPKAKETITQTERGTSAVDAKYAVMRNISTMGPVVPGLAEDLIPQGLAWWPGQKWLATSYYLKNGKPSVVTLTDSQSGKLVKSLRLAQEDGLPYSGHAGGLAISRDNLWVASNSALYRIPLSALLEAPDNSTMKFAGRFPVETNASFVAYHDGILWVGEFNHPSGGYTTAASHQLTNRTGAAYGAWIAGYRVDPATDQPAAAAKPDYVLSIPNQIQGMALLNDSIILSRSYGRKNDSHLFRYVRPDLAGAPHQTVTLGGRTIPVWFLDEKAQVAKEPVVTLPPLAEGIAPDGAGRLYVLYESGANEYRFDGFNPLDRWSVVDLAKWGSP